MPVEIKTTINPSPWKEQYARMLRWRERMDSAREPNESFVLDNIHSFFIACFHLKDWLTADRSVNPAIGPAAEALFNATDARECMKICADRRMG